LLQRIADTENRTQRCQYPGNAGSIVMH
jgi:hypothetical protein